MMWSGVRTDDAEYTRTVPSDLLLLFIMMYKVATKMKSVVRLSVFGEVVYSLAQIKANLELDPDCIEYMFTGEALFSHFFLCSAFTVIYMAL